jgi:hypothetical protein
MHEDATAMTFFHEVVHSWLFDTGVANAFTPEQQEAVCDAVALGLHRSGMAVGTTGRITAKGGK